MRISTSMLTKISLDAMLNQQAALSNTQLQVTTGQRIISPSDDPYGSSRSLDLQESISLNEQYQVNAGYAKNRLNLEESSLTGVGNAIQRVRELMVVANNDSQTPESRGFIREEINQLLDQVLALSNSTDSNGEYIFAGYQGKTKPFAVDGAGNYSYFGDKGSRLLKMSSSTSVAMGDSGEGTFLTIKNGNGTFQTRDHTTNTGTAIVDPGTVYGTYVPDNYQVKFIPPATGDLRDPLEYYVLDGQGDVIVPAAYVGSAEGAYLTDVQNRVPASAGVQYQEGAVIQGLDTLGIKISIAGKPAISTTPVLSETSMWPVANGPYPALTGGDGFDINPSKFQSLFATVKSFSDTLASNQGSETELTKFHNSVNRSLIDLDQAMGRVLDVRSRIGARLNTVDKQIEINESFSLQMNETLSSIQDLDYAEAITRMNLQLTGLQAAQNAYTKIQDLSLFNYI